MTESTPHAKATFPEGTLRANPLAMCLMAKMCAVLRWA